jgi:uncharacterized protein (TIGR00725 family)
LKGLHVTYYIGVVGASNATSGQIDFAHEVGELLAARGAILVCGGLGGVMEAACRGAQGLGGLTVGLLPTADRSQANDYVTVALTTGLGELRNGLIVRSSDAIIGIGSGWGTLSELALARRTDVPVFLLDSWIVVRERSGEEVEVGVAVSDPQQAVSSALEAAKRRRLAG